MTEQIFRYIVVLVAVIVVIRILLGVSANKAQENSGSITKETAQSTVVPEMTPITENRDEFHATSQLPEQMGKESDHE